MKKCDVICIGNAAVDVPLSPVSPEIFNYDSYAIDRIVLQPGGSGNNVAIILARMGVSTKLVTLLGKDLLGDFLIENCRQNKVDTSAIICSDDVDTPLSIGLVRNDGERGFVVSRHSSTFAFQASHIDCQLFSDAKILMFSSIFIMPKFNEAGLIQIFSTAKKANMIVCADMMRSRTGERIDAIVGALPYIDYFFANREEAAFLTGEEHEVDMARKLMDAGVKNVLIKDGKRGCFIFNGDGGQTIPAFRNEHPVDTIGAGDNFAAGFVAALLDGYSFAEAARFANATAAISVSAAGSTGGVKNKQQVCEILSSAENRS